MPLKKNEKKEKEKEKVTENIGNDDNANANKGFFTNTISTLYKRKENYSHIRTYFPSNAFPSYKILLKLISEMWDHPELKGFTLIKKYNKLRFYQNNDNPKIILVGIYDTNFDSLSEIYTGVCNAVLKIDLKKLDRYKNDLQNLIEFQKKYPTDKYYYIATGISIAGSIADLFLEAGYLNEAITFNAVIEGRFISNPNIKNYRIYLDEDICYLSMGKYAPNTKVYSLNMEKQHFINPIKEFNHLFKLHTLNNERSASLSFFKKILKNKNSGFRLQ